ncbi:ABC-type multidrug transport system fused ATPase/permease subunit [Actinoplanes campanulatus]|uniref:ABC-type multidrug transport system fused ATPase/permease subunit n=1 Tax=Actinoplanes campanulatus TaxID=113559 RepID=A0A7W5AJX7_9ACTN|nr:ABC transporter ATP-binding protein [Actinoplanes campanulatus]MBB3097477.1 ABC-type multidrug transport system fused ATPase/permease subunit [Actinoplanes campanulatus]GGN27080.1 multidrug ABC transporter ATP-binding protein [Actinoplanes campanulatus]GID38061.1 multidrug ABC transporter ATP-binding protein [Actinoplanes campanulatus]
MTRLLPVASAVQARRYARDLIRRYPAMFRATVALHAAAALAGLAGPRLLGDMVQGIHDGVPLDRLDRLALMIGGFVLAQSVLIRFAHLASARLGERVLARLREEFVTRVLGLPLSTVEAAGSGDLLTRTTRDVDALSKCVRFAVPETLIALITLLLVVAALLLVSPVFAVPLLIGVPIMTVGTRWYLRHAPRGYLRQNAAYSDVTEGLTETVEGARTVEAMRRQLQRAGRTDADLRRSWRAERYTLRLRTVWWPVIEISYVLPMVLTLLAGGLLYLHDTVTLGELTAAVVYVQQLVDPLDRLVGWLDELEVGGAALARLLGVTADPQPQPAVTTAPDGTRVELCGVRFGYEPGREVLHGVDLVLEPGERLAVVGVSGAGKSTLGRLLAGVYQPTSGTITVGGTPLAALPPERLRAEVALVTQEHHVFVGTLRDNVAMVRPGVHEGEVRAALTAVQALHWADALPDGLDTVVGAGGHPLSPAQAQQVALARLVIADPHTLVLDEATAMLDPRAARDLERSLAAVVSGRTVVAIAHRLFSAHDADRVAVVEDGRITELGPHDELVAAGGAYAALWRSWQGGTEPAEMSEHA